MALFLITLLAITAIVEENRENKGTQLLLKSEE